MTDQATAPAKPAGATKINREPWPADSPVMNRLTLPPRLQALRYSASTYVMVLAGSCLEPELRDGDFAIVDPEAPLEPGAFVVLWPKGGDGPILKRLVSRMTIRPEELHPDSDAIPLLRIEALNPRRHYLVPIDKLLTVHAVVATIPKDEAACLLSEPQADGRAAA